MAGLSLLRKKIGKLRVPAGLEYFSLTQAVTSIQLLIRNNHTELKRFILKPISQALVINNNQIDSISPEMYGEQHN